MKTKLQQKLELVQHYILVKKGIRVLITFKDGNNERELLMVDQAFEYAQKHFMTHRSNFYG